MKTPSPRFVLLAAAAALSLCACASDSLRPADCVAMTRADQEASDGIPYLNGDARNYSARSSASYTGLQSEMGMR